MLRRLAGGFARLQAADLDGALLPDTLAAGGKNKKTQHLTAGIQLHLVIFYFVGIGYRRTYNSVLVTGPIASGVLTPSLALLQVMNEREIYL